MTTETPNKTAEVFAEFVRYQQQQALTRLHEEMTKLENTIKKSKPKEQGK